ncbi:hypothetical protein GCM10010842_15050 [Deinococcus daejeonensis]|uniref:Uncharacterized protein n=1 Tax=Deinococcus daejeonensis TaxID=1007098 RepID=A0ABQ2IZ54_9DEIO|nr:hypothetical protein GCM10010842_15050 [Deinococcus daejeonensis]
MTGVPMGAGVPPPPQAARVRVSRIRAGVCFGAVMVFPPCPQGGRAEGMVPARALKVTGVWKTGSDRTVTG